MSPFPKNLPLFFIIFISFFSATESSHPSVGITFTNRGGNTNIHLPHQQQIVSTLQSLKITSVRLTDSNPDIIRSFSYSGISLLLSIPNSLIPYIASNQSEALRWLNRHVTPFYPRVQISTISVGINALDDESSTDFLLSAVQSVRQALDELGIRKISVSTTFTFVEVIASPFPPSSAQFQESVGESLMKPLLDFLVETNSSFLVNLYPYNLYRTEPLVPLGYALFEEYPFSFHDDLMTGIRYRNLFDMMVDSVITAMAVLGHENVPLIVTETGWPSYDETKDPEANQMYAEMYIKGLISHLNSGFGTPLRKDGVAETYIYELFDEDTKDKRQWGIMNSDMSLKYNIDFSSSGRVHLVNDLLKVLMVVLTTAVILLQR